VTSIFARTALVHTDQRGYDEASVDAFTTEVSRHLTSAENEIDDLRAEVDRLHRYIRRQWAAVAAAEATGAAHGGGARGGTGSLRMINSAGHPVQSTPPSATAARAVLNQAQDLAERRLGQADERLAEAERLALARVAAADQQARTLLAEADRRFSNRLAEADGVAARRLAKVDAVAEQVLLRASQEARTRRAQAADDARRLLSIARTQYEEIVIRAHQRADRAAEAALGEFEAQPSDQVRTRAELELKAAYLRTFAKVSRAALQTALDVTAREFDRLVGISAASEARTPS
jgi:hypothetical protein